MHVPQPVCVGDLPGRAVIEPVEAQTMLGRVRSIVRDDGGMAPVGDVLEPVADMRAELLFDLSSATRLGDDALIRVGLAKPSH